MVDSHPSGLSGGELAHVSMEFWCSTVYKADKDFEKLLAFQLGWKACKDYYDKYDTTDI